MMSAAAPGGIFVGDVGRVDELSQERPCFVCEKFILRSLIGWTGFRGDGGEGSGGRGAEGEGVEGGIK